MAVASYTSNNAPQNDMRPLSYSGLAEATRDIRSHYGAHGGLLSVYSNLWAPFPGSPKKTPGFPQEYGQHAGMEGSATNSMKPARSSCKEDDQTFRQLSLTFQKSVGEAQT